MRLEKQHCFSIFFSRFAISQILPRLCNTKVNLFFNFQNYYQFFDFINISHKHFLLTPLLLLKKRNYFAIRLLNE